MIKHAYGNVPMRALAAVAAVMILVGGLAVVGIAADTITIDLAAKNLAFDKAVMTVPAGAEVTIHFVNNDAGTPHNVAVYDTSAAKQTIFQGKRITGPQSIDYRFAAPTTPGSYFFRCDVHPAMMTGRFVVVPAVVVDLTARQLAFDKTTITVPAGAYVRVHFTNDDSGIPHNFAVYDTAAAQTVFFQGARITGPQTADYTFFAPAQTGSNFFRCDVHPAMMTGAFVVVPAVVVDVSARGMAFDTPIITVPAGAYVTVHFTNSDSGIPHNVAFYDSSAVQTVFFQGEVVTGPKTIDYTFFAPQTPGTYFFRCDVHPALMTGDFVVTPPTTAQSGGNAAPPADTPPGGYGNY